MPPRSQLSRAGRGTSPHELRATEQKSACWYGLRPSFVGSPRCDSLGGLKGPALSKSLECPTNIKGDLGWSCQGWGRGTRLDRMPWNCCISRFATGLPRRRLCLWRWPDGMWDFAFGICDPPSGGFEWYRWATGWLSEGEDFGDGSFCEMSRFPEVSAKHEGGMALPPCLISIRLR